jgi:hypothetical protein
MKKLILFSLLLIGCSSLSFAQQADAFYNTPYESRNSGSFGKTTGIISLGYGFGNDAFGYNYQSGTSGSTNVSFGPLYAKYEHGFLRDEIGLGGQLALSNAWARYDNGTDRYRDKITAFSFSMLGYYHFNKLIPVPRLDVYAGTGLSIRTVSYTYDSDFSENPNNNSTTNLYVIGKVGARYFVTQGFGFYAEAGMDKMSDVNLGITFRL